MQTQDSCVGSIGQVPLTQGQCLHTRCITASMHPLDAQRKRHSKAPEDLLGAMHINASIVRMLSGLPD